MTAIIMEMNRTMTVSELRWNLKQQLNRFRLNFRAKAVYRYLADKVGIDGLCWPSISTITDECSLSRRTVIRATKDLEEAGLLKKTAFFRGNGGQTSNRYHLSLLPIASYTEDTRADNIVDADRPAPSKLSETSKEDKPKVKSLDGNHYSTMEIKCKPIERIEQCKKQRKMPSLKQRDKEKRRRIRAFVEFVQKSLKVNVSARTLSVTRGVCQFDIPRISNFKSITGEKINSISTLVMKYVNTEDDKKKEGG